MKACVLIACPVDQGAALALVLSEFATMRASEPLHAELLATIGTFRAIVAAEGYLVGVNDTDVSEAPIIRIDRGMALADLPGVVAGGIARAHRDDHRRATELERLTALPYSTYLDMVRFRATRRYLLGLMRRHRGSVTEASLTAGIARESLHRQLRQHDVDAEAFREGDGR